MARRVHPTPNIAWNVFVYRELRRWSQTKLAARCGLSLSTIARLECGMRAASPETLAKIARALGVKRRMLLAPRPKLPPLPDETRAA